MAAPAIKLEFPEEYTLVETNQKIKKRLDRFTQKGIEQVSEFIGSTAIEAMFYIYLLKKYKSSCFLTESNGDFWEIFGINLRIREIYSEEEKKTGILGYIYALLIIIGYAAISIFIDKRLNKIYASGKSKNGFIEFNKPLSLEISSVIISILGVLLCASFGLNCFYSGEYLFCCVSILVILIPLKRFLKEYKNVRCSVLLSPSIIILKGNDKEIKIDTNTIEKLDLTYKESSKGSRSITESKLFITKKDGDTITFNLCSNNLEKFSPAIKIQMNEFYADKMQN